MSNNLHYSFILPRELLIQEIPIGTECKFSEIPLNYYAVFNPKGDKDGNKGSRTGLFVKIGKNKAIHICLKSTFLRVGLKAFNVTVESIKSIGKNQGEFFLDDTLVEVVGYLETISQHEQRRPSKIQITKIIPLRK